MPVYDGFIVAKVDFVDDRGDTDARLVIGVGPNGHKPRAYVALCPCDDVAELVADLQRVGAIAAEHHQPHLPPLAA